MIFLENIRKSFSTNEQLDRGESIAITGFFSLIGIGTLITLVVFTALK